MIQHHCTSQELLAFGSGKTTAGDSVAISAHLEFCVLCANKLRQLEAQVAQDWDQLSPEAVVVREDPAPILDSILSTPLPDLPDAPVAVSNRSKMEVGEQQFDVPAVLGRLVESGLKWRKLPGGVRLAKVKLDNQNICSFLYMQPGGKVGMHTHEGKETTLVIGGSFFDAEGEYREGDFIQRGEDDNHTSLSKEGCLCFTVQDNPVVFTKGLSRLFNPISRRLMS